MVRCRRHRDLALAAGGIGWPFDPLSCRWSSRGEPVFSRGRAADKPVKPMAGTAAAQTDQLPRGADRIEPLYLLASIGAVIGSLTLATPMAFETLGDNAFMALTIP